MRTDVGLAGMEAVVDGKLVWVLVGVRAGVGERN